MLTEQIVRPANELVHFDAAADTRVFRDSLGSFSTGVALVAAEGPAGRIGMVVNSFTSVSLDPPLISFCAMRRSDSWSKIRESGTFSVSVLSHEHEDVARKFVNRATDRFETSDWVRTPFGNPALSDALAWFDTTIESISDAGDHELIIGRVGACARPVNAQPLVFFNGKYARLHAVGQ